LYVLDFADRLEAGDTISAVTWTVTNGITTADSSYDDSTVEIEATGGTVNTAYTFQAVADTLSGRKHERSFLVQVVDR
jgi:hypothetical protein